MSSQVIVHTTDLSGTDGAAFVHACALAARAQARLVSLHGNASAEEAARLPEAKALTERWQRARPEAALAVEHQRRCHECCDDVTDTLLDAIRQIGPGLVVTGATARRGLAALVHTSVSEALARNVEVPTLVVPNGCRGFVDAENGRVDLRRVLVPAVDVASARVGLAAARTLCALAGVEAGELLVLHVGDAPLVLPVELSAGVRLMTARGRLEEAISEVAQREGACVIVMPTHGHDGIGDTLWGSHTEHVMREARCPVLVVPLAPGE